MGLRGPKKGERFGGRQKGTPNKVPALLKDAIIEAATRAGGEEGLVGYLQSVAMEENKGPFVGLLGKVLPIQLNAKVENEQIPFDELRQVVLDEIDALGLTAMVIPPNKPAGLVPKTKKRGASGDE